MSAFDEIYPLRRAYRFQFTPDMQPEIVISLLEKIYSELIRLKARVKVIDEKIGAPATRVACVDKANSSPNENEACVRVIVSSDLDRQIHIVSEMERYTLLSKCLM